MISIFANISYLKILHSCNLHSCKESYLTLISRDSFCKVKLTHKLFTMEPENPDLKTLKLFENPLILDTIFINLPLSSLCSCRLVNSLWSTTASIAIRKALRTRLLLCADAKCTTKLNKFMGTFQNSSTIPYTRAILMLDHLPNPETNSPECQAGEMELLVQLSELFSDQFQASSSSGSNTTLFPDVPARGRNGETVKAACDMFSTYIDNLIINLTQHQDTPDNINYWLKNISFVNLCELSFHITRTSPEKISQGSLDVLFNSLPNLKTFGLRKLTKKCDQLMVSLLLALTRKSHLNRCKNLSLEIFTDNKEHLEVLLKAQFYLEDLSIIYLGGEVRFIEKMELIRRFLQNVSKTLQHLYTHLPLFSNEQQFFPKLPCLQTLKIEKVYREFAYSQSQLFGFDFHKYFPNIVKIIFKDYDLWKNMQLKTFPVDEVVPCAEVPDISLPDLCFDVPLLERYFLKFPNLRKLSIVVSYVSRYQRQCSFCMVYAFLPNLKDLSVSLFEMDLPEYDHIFTGLAEEKSREILAKNEESGDFESGLSMKLLKELEYLKITSTHGKRILGITDLSVKFAFLGLPSLKHLTIGPSRITSQGMLEMKEKFVVTMYNHGFSQTLLAGTSNQPVVPENRDLNIYETERPSQELDY